MVLNGKDFIRAVCAALDTDDYEVVEININAKYANAVEITIYKRGDERLYKICNEIGKPKE